MSDAVDSTAGAAADETLPRRATPSPSLDEADQDPQEPAPTQAEAQFPYTSLQGLQPTSPTSQPAQDVAAAEPDTAAPPLPPAGTRPGRVRWVPVLLGGIASLVGLGIIVVSLVWGRGLNPLAPVPGAGAPPASTAVRSFLAALAAGDAGEALAQAAAVPADRTFLTDTVLAASQARLSGIDVPVTGNQPASQTITARYAIGDRQVSAPYTAFRNDSTWRLGRVTAAVTLPRFGDLRLLVNGVAAPGGTAELFPGAYTLAVDDPRYALRGATFVVDGPGDTPRPAPELVVSDQAAAQIAAAARAHLDTCLAAVDFDPAECGFRIAHPSGTKLDESTVRWRVVSGAGALDDLEPVVDRVGTAVAPTALVVRANVEGKDGSRWQATARITKVYADLSGDKVRVEFG